MDFPSWLEVFDRNADLRLGDLNRSTPHLNGRLNPETS